MSDENWQRKLQNYPPMSKKQHDVLGRLMAAKQADALWIELDGVDPRTTRALFERDLIFKSEHETGTRYKITLRGEKAYKAYLKPRRRSDGICPRCGCEPVHHSASGKSAGYCKSCVSKIYKRRYELNINQRRHDRLCARCHKFPVYVRKSGRAIAYCLSCYRVRGRKQHRKRRKQEYKRLLAGEKLLCPKCGQPRYVTGRTIQDYCFQHYSEYRRARYRKSREGVQPKPLGRPRKAVQP